MTVRALVILLFLAPFSSGDHVETPQDATEDTGVMVDAPVATGGDEATADDAGPVKTSIYRAAVYEHVLHMATPCYTRLCTREEAIDHMEVNLAVFREKVEEAAQLGADIIVLPEDGIHGYGWTRKFVRPFLEFVPWKLYEEWKPCHNQSELDDAYVQTALSCMAETNKIYVVANFGTWSPGCGHCGEDHGDECFFNTNVVFDPHGAVVSVYRKYHLWTTELSLYDIEPRPRLEYVDTPLGRLGSIVCEDLLWESPTVDLVELGGVDTLIVPLAWYDMFPHQMAHVDEAAWARGLQVNLLSANILAPKSWQSGSGVFGPDGPYAYYHNVTSGSSGMLVVADLDIKPKKTVVNWNQYAEINAPEHEESPGKFTAVVYGDKYDFVPMTSGMKVAKVCTRDSSLCCLSQFEAVFGDDVFALGVFSGLHHEDGSIIGQYYMDMCTIMKCDVNNINACEQNLTPWKSSKEDYNFLSKSTTKFSSLSLSGTFSAETRVYPEVVFDEATLQPAFVDISTSGLLSLKSTAPPVVSMSLVGRIYQRDGPLPHQWCPGWCPAPHQWNSRWCPARKTFLDGI